MPKGYDADPTDVTTVSLDPPLPVYLFNVVAGLRDKSAKGYPVKKVWFLLMPRDVIGCVSCLPS